MRQKSYLSATEARAIRDLCLAEAERHEWNVCIAVVDEGGYVLSVERMDGAALLTPETAIGKARTAALFRGSSKTLEDRLADRLAFLKLPQYIPIQGGVAIMVGVDCLGGIGVSGVQSDCDEQIAIAGLAAVK